MAQPTSPKDAYEWVKVWLDETGALDPKVFAATTLRKIGKSAALGMGYGGSMQGAYAQAQTRRWAQMAQNESNETRFRSFAERYMIARAPSFRDGHEEEDQWTCILNAKSAFRKIEAMGRGVTNEDEKLAKEMGPGQGPTQAAAGANVTGRLPNPVGPATPLQSQSPMLDALQRIGRASDVHIRKMIEADSKSWTGYYRRGKGKTK